MPDLNIQRITNHQTNAQCSAVVVQLTTLTQTLHTHTHTHVRGDPRHRAAGWSLGAEAESWRWSTLQSDQLGGHATHAAKNLELCLGGTPRTWGTPGHNPHLSAGNGAGNRPWQCGAGITSLVTPPWTASQVLPLLAAGVNFVFTWLIKCDPRPPFIRETK